MIAGGVGFMMNMLNLSEFLLQFKILHFLGLVFIAIVLKYLVGYLKPDIHDPIMAHPLAKKIFLGSMGALALALFMRKYDFPYYNIILYIDIFAQLAALGVSFSVKEFPNQRNDEEILDI
jgi:hypothetical protein